MSDVLKQREKSFSDRLIDIYNLISTREELQEALSLAYRLSITYPDPRSEKGENKVRHMLMSSNTKSHIIGILVADLQQQITVIDAKLVENGVVP